MGDTADTLVQHQSHIFHVFVEPEYGFAGTGILSIPLSLDRLLLLPQKCFAQVLKVYQQVDLVTIFFGFPKCPLV